MASRAAEYAPFDVVWKVSDDDVKFQWCCSCTEYNPSDATVRCDNCRKIWSHVKCCQLDHLTETELRDYHHICFDCRPKINNQKRRWTNDDDELLAKYKQEQLSPKQISRALGRSVAAIAQRKYNLLKNKPNKKKKNKLDERENQNDDFEEDKEDAYHDVILNEEDVKSLEIGDQIDHRDKYGQFFPAKIINKQHNKMKIHYKFYKEKWDKWVDINSNQDVLNKFARYNSISKMESLNKNLKIGSEVNVRRSDNNEWELCEIIGMDNKRKHGKSGQIRVTNHSDYTYWYHPNNHKEVKIISPERSNKKRALIDDSGPTTKRRKICNDIPNVDNIQKDVIRGGIGNNDNDHSKVIFNTNWNTDDVLAWLMMIGYDDYSTKLESKFRKQEINGVSFAMMDINDLEHLGITNFNDRKLIFEEIKKLRNN